MLRDEKRESPTVSRDAPFRVSAVFGHPAGRAPRRALNRFDQAVWTRPYGWAMALPFFVLLAYGPFRGMGMEDFRSFELRSRVGPIFLMLLPAVAGVDLPSRWAFKRVAMANRPLSTEFAEDGIRWSNEGLKGEIPWRKAMRLAMLEGFPFLFTGTFEAVGVSRRALPSDEAFDDLVAYAKERANGQAL